MTRSSVLPPFTRRGVVLGGTAALLVRAPARAADAGSVALLHAGSLVRLVERGLAPGFRSAAGGQLVSFAGGSNALANQIRGRLRRGDVFISASPSADAQLSGAANGDWVGWYASFARSPVVLGFNPDGRFAAALKTRPWFEAMQMPGLRIARTDPTLDPKGAFTVQLMQRAEAALHMPGLMQRILGAPNNPAQVQPEPNLVGRLQSGEIDVGFFYSTEAHDLAIATLPFPAAIAVSAQYTVTILRDAPNPAGAEAFVRFLLGPDGLAVLRANGLDPVPPVLSGDAGRVPASLRALLLTR